jgi:hypothetical protein
MLAEGIGLSGIVSILFTGIVSSTLTMLPWILFDSENASIYLPSSSSVTKFNLLDWLLKNFTSRLWRDTHSQTYQKILSVLQPAFSIFFHHWQKLLCKPNYSLACICKQLEMKSWLCFYAGSYIWDLILQWNAKAGLMLDSYFSQLYPSIGLNHQNLYSTHYMKYVYILLFP